MARRIVYIDENKNPIGRSVFLEPYKERGIDTDSILRLLDRLDYAGGFQLSEEEYLKALQRLPRETRLFLGDSTNINSGVSYLRGNEYYLHIAFDEDIERVRKRLIENTKKLQDLLSIFSKEDFNLEEKIVASSILDHKRHYSLTFLVGLYNHMLLDPDFNVDAYRRFRKVCEMDIDNYYRFLLLGESPKIEILEDSELSHILDIDLPIDTPRETGARRWVLREMDHPGQLVLYSGNLLAKDGENKIDAVVNPLTGAVEIGFALKSIFNLYGIDKVDEVHFVRYSPYGEGHIGPITQEEIELYIPTKLVSCLARLKNKRIFIIDDNSFTGNSLRAIRSFLRNYSNDINLGVIEVPIELIGRRRTQGLSYLDLKELAIPVISNWRYIDRVEEEIREYNFAGKYGNPNRKI